ncbi:unnamed protein product [Durusdinium trenchii]|uniref:Uncharacterized protein n=1 Tax=Durusdinium trenchii TaxID=1381693 RepID=A0ABP0LWS0_9DINO
MRCGPSQKQSDGRSQSWAKTTRLFFDEWVGLVLSRWWAAPATRAKEQDTQFDMYRCSSISKAQILIFRGKAGSTEESTEERWPTQTRCS